MDKKKKQERDRIQLEKKVNDQEEELEQCTFKPDISKTIKPPEEEEERD